MGIFNFEDQLLQYGQYHHAKLNQLVHFVFVPTILWTVQVWLTQTPTFGEWAFTYLWPLNAAFIVTAVYNIYYIVLDPVAGTLYAPVLFGLLHYANTFAAKDQVFDVSPQIAAVAIHASSWIAQFLSHGLIEGRAPALLDNFFQALVLAPFFVWVEMLFTLGYRPQLQERLDSRIKHAIGEWKASKTKKVK
ncbi:uncharacterized protein EV422DRAFT_563568 [Fimicolochytrium jonesii]|uniref:uncharacterized protein n=1 Tax=Fimicolochytrium jonesii TaxID=1396493 RepID=UPI0022FE6146|nr:uncharacterized protein EV422DRAFT_563568 [Fimicolochytrium jonesii]KAI8825737.1 hypothetical protein EV422DRAFT_563568 [Fimicolochytrium jonesii]